MLKYQNFISTNLSCSFRGWAMAVSRAALLLLPCRRLQLQRTVLLGLRPKIRFFSESGRSEPRFQLQVSLARVLQRYGFPQSQLHAFIRDNAFLLDSSASASEAEDCIGILLSLGLSQNALVSALLSCPALLQLRFLRRCQQSGLPALPSSSAPRFLVKIMGDLHRSVLLPALKGLGLTDPTVLRVLDELPLGFTARDDVVVGLERRIHLLKSIGIDSMEIDRVFYSFPGFSVLSMEGRLRPLFREFQELGFGRSEVRKALLDDPGLALSMEAGELYRCMDLLNSLKCRMPIRERILAGGPLAACILVKLRVDLLCKYGLIRRDAFKVVWVEPRTILYELQDLEKKIEFLMHDISLGVEWLVQFPEYLGMNLEKQIIPRCNVVEYLRSRGGLGFEVGLKHLVKYSRLKFYNLFVKPYPDCEKIFGGAVREVRVKPRHPTGLWKLFKPLRYPDSKEDIRNIKSFMEFLV